VVAVAKYRRFSGAEKQRILAAADRCIDPGEIGALLRRETIYSSQLATWRAQRRKAERAALRPATARTQTRCRAGGKTPRRSAEARDRASTAASSSAHTPSSMFKKKLCTLLGLPTAQENGEDT